MDTPKNHSIPIYLTTTANSKPPTSCHGREKDAYCLFLLFTSWSFEREAYVSSKEPRKKLQKKITLGLIEYVDWTCGKEGPRAKGFWGLWEYAGVEYLHAHPVRYLPLGIECWSLFDSGLD